MLPFLRRLFWLSAAGLLSQFVLMLTMKIGLDVAIQSLLRSQPALRRTYEQVQAQTDFAAMTTYASDLDRFFAAMAPIFSRLDWHALALVTSLIGFGLLGFLFTRLAGTMEYLGILVLFSLPTGQNPVTVAMVLADRGVDQARFSWPFMVWLLTTQMLALYASGWLGMQAYGRARRHVTTR